MKRAALLLSVALAGCGDSRSFDERYEDTQRNLHERAHNLDTAMNNASSALANNSAEPRSPIILD